MEKKKSFKKVLKTVFIFLLVLILIVGIYVIYAFAFTKRIPDNFQLGVNDNTKAVMETGKKYSISTFNIGYGGIPADFSFFMEGGDDVNVDDISIIKEDTNGVIEMLNALNPDIMLFQEVDSDSTRSYHYDQYERLCEEYSNYDSNFSVNYHSAYLLYPFNEPIGKSVSGIASFSSFNIVSGVRRQLNISSGLSRVVDLDRCYTVNEIQVNNDKSLFLYNVHLTAYGGSAEISDSQVKMLAADMKEKADRGDYVICGGDFNHDFTGDSLKLLNDVYEEQDWTKPLQKEFFADCFSFCTDYDTGLCGTSRLLATPYIKGETDVFIIDGFIISDNITCEYQKIIDGQFLYTDHNPVYMEFVLN